MIVYAVAPLMIVVDFLLPNKRLDDCRGKHSGVAQALWYLGPVVVLLMSLALTSLGSLGARIVFAHLLVIPLGLTILRSKMRESQK